MIVSVKTIRWFKLLGVGTWVILVSACAGGKDAAMPSASPNTRERGKDKSQSFIGDLKVPDFGVILLSPALSSSDKLSIVSGEESAVITVRVLRRPGDRPAQNVKLTPSIQVPNDLGPNLGYFGPASGADGILTDSSGVAEFKFRAPAGITKRCDIVMEVTVAEMYGRTVEPLLLNAVVMPR